MRHDDRHPSDGTGYVATADLLSSPLFAPIPILLASTIAAVIALLRTPSPTPT